MERKTTTVKEVRVHCKVTFTIYGDETEVVEKEKTFAVTTAPQTQLGCVADAVWHGRDALLSDAVNEVAWRVPYFKAPECQWCGEPECVTAGKCLNREK